MSAGEAGAVRLGELTAAALEYAEAGRVLREAMDRELPPRRGPTAEGRTPERTAALNARAADVRELRGAREAAAQAVLRAADALTPEDAGR